ncbi:MAG: hypothetical protein ABS36_16745 [Acidobacteria bacterium SCN 69-37]|nr:MAG: hypothetical protein ABS36_16745 [Acidobacteria bacterium SCN 69-37]
MRSTRLALVLTASLASGVLVPVFGAGPSFRPDLRFEGSSLTGWNPIGQADWRAAEGEITGTPKADTGGWLVFDRSWQDTGFFSTFQCAAGCRAGVLLRAEKTADGLKGIYVSLTEGDVGAYALTIDASGRETSRTRLRVPGGGQVRIAPPPTPDAPGRGRVGGPAAPPAAGRGGRGPAVQLPIPTPNTGLHPGEWNDLEILIDANIVRTFINNAGPSGVADDAMGRFGSVALHVAGTGPVRFKAIAFKDLGVRTREAEKVSPRFRVQQISDFYYSFGASAADFNHDGVTDVVAGPHIYFGPDYQRSREIYLTTTINPSVQFANDAWMQFAYDFTGDGWPDVLNASFSGENAGATLYVNPKGESRRWDSYRVTSAQQTEIAVLEDVDGDGKPELVYGAQGAMHYAKPDPANPTEPWIVRTVSETGYATAHGVGVGDVNGDGRKDILNAYGWWEQPANASATGPWQYHPQAFGRPIGRTSAGGSVMAVYDVNGDGLNDVVTSLSAHGWGLAWYEQKRDASGTISFEQHMIMDDHNWPGNAGGVSFSQLHGTTVADIDADGIPDFIVGKRYWSHQDTQIDPDPYGPPVIYWYRTVRNPKAPGGAEFVPELIHNQSGVGSDAWAGDINRDGHVDIVTSTKFGTFIFWGK